MTVINVGNAGLSADDSGGGVQTLSVTLTSAQATGDLIVILINYDPSLTLFSGFPQDTSANAFTQAGTTISNADYKQEIWYCLSAKSASASANAVSVKLSATGAQGNFSVRVYTFQAPGRVWVKDQFNHTSGTSATVTSGTVTTTAANEVLVGKSGVQNSVTGGEGGSWVTAANDGLGDSAEYLIATSIQTNVAATFTQVSGLFVCSIATFAALAALEEHVPPQDQGWSAFPPILASVEEYVPIPALALEEYSPPFQPQDIAIYAMAFAPVEEIVAAAAPSVALEEYAPPPQPQDVAIAAPLFAQAEEIVAAAVAAAALEEWHAPFQADAMAAGATPAPVGDELPSSGGWLEEWSPAFAPDAYAPSPLLFAADEELPFFIAPTFAPEEWAPWQPETWAPATPVLFAQEEWLQIPVRAFEEYAPPVFPPGPDTSGGSYLAAAWLGEELVVFTPPPPSTGGIVFWNRHDGRVIRGR